MRKKNKWPVLILLVLFIAACSLEGNLGGDTSYTVSFDKNGGNGDLPRSQTVKSSSSIRLPSGDSLSKNGFTFGGWNSESSGEGRDYSAGSFYTPTGNVTLYAKWIPVAAPNYTVTFDANGGNGSPPAQQTVKAGSSITLPGSSGLTNNGYNFNGWNTNASGTGSQYSAGYSYTINSDITLYAMWVSPVTSYVVAFSANGGSGTPPAAQTVSAGSGITLPSGSGLSKGGFTFGGWNTDASGSGALYGAGSFYTPNSDITLYANWNAVVTTTTYTVTFNANGGNGTAPASLTVNAGSSITLPNGSGLSKSGFSFGGWNTNTSGTGTGYKAGDSYTVTGNVTLYAKWDANVASYTVTFNANGGSGTAPASQTAQSGSAITLPNGSGLTRNGYTFGGWNTNTSGTGTTYKAGDSYTVTGNVTLYAKWDTSVASYTVTFNANGGSGTTPASQTAQSGSAITLPNAGGLSKSGYTFGGWNTNTSGTGTTYKVGDSYTVTGNVTLYAKWDTSVASYTVTFNANGGSGTAPASQTVQSGSAIVLPNGSGLSRSGYTFSGWNTNTSGTETTYKAGDSYTVTGNVTLYAKWDTSVASYTVTFNANGGSGTVPAAQTVSSGSSIALPSGSGLQKAGCTFGGWNTNTSGTGTNYRAGDSYTVTGNVTLYAKWDANVVSYTVTFNANGGSGTVPAAQTVNAGLSITLPNGNLMSKSGCVFDGWNSNSSGTGTNYNAGNFFTPTANITLYAKWKSQFAIGDTGPGGGKIFYTNVAGFTMADTGEICHYLEVSPVDLFSSDIWASYLYTETNISGTSTSIGAGRKNTAIILSIDSNAPAAKSCRDYSGGSASDWFLPSRDELNQIYVNMSYIGNISHFSWYWSSSQYDNSLVWFQNFDTGKQDKVYKYVSIAVRAVRAF